MSLSMLIYWDRNGDVVLTLPQLVERDEDDGQAKRLKDFDKHAREGRKFRELGDAQLLDAPIPAGVAKKVLGRDPLPNEVPKLPPDHPFRVAHELVAGAGTWPEWIPAVPPFGDPIFRVELDAGKRITALVHKVSGHRRERTTIEAAIAARIRASGDRPADLRSLIGGPSKPLALDENGKTIPRPVAPLPDSVLTSKPKPAKE